MDSGDIGMEISGLAEGGDMADSQPFHDDAGPDESALREIEETQVEDLEPLTDILASGGTNNIQVLALYLRDIGRFRVMDREQERALANRVVQDRLAARDNPGARDLRARTLFVNSNLRLVVSIAKRYVKPGRELLDLIQWGTEGLLKAVDKFRPEYGYKFSTYGTWWIRQAIQRELNDNQETIRIPVHSAEAYRKYAKVEARLLAQRGSATVEEVACKLGWPLVVVHKILERHRMNLPPASFSSPLGHEDEGSFGDLIPDRSPRQDSIIAQARTSEHVRKSVRRALNEREFKIIGLRFGFDGGDEMTLEQVGDVIGVTRERIRQIEAKALRKLRNRLMGKV